MVNNDNYNVYWINVLLYYMYLLNHMLKKMQVKLF